MCLWPRLRRPKDFTSIPAEAWTCVCLCVCASVYMPQLWSLSRVWVWYWSSGQQVGVHLDISDEGNAHASASRISSHRVGGRASQQQAGIESRRDARRCPRLLEQRPNRGVL